MIRGGASISPEYNLTIYGNGKVIYEGIDNVYIKGIKQKTIDENAVLSILDEFKESGFFSLSDKFSIEESINRSYTIISITIPKENNQTVTKSIKFYHGDRQVPIELKNLENKIDKIVGTVDWISGLNEEFQPKKESISTTMPHVKKKMTWENRKKKPIFLISFLIIIVIFVIILVFSFYTGIISLPEEKIVEESPSFVIFESASFVDNITGDFTPSESFNIGDVVYIYLKYSDISTDNNTCNLYFELITYAQ